MFEQGVLTQTQVYGWVQASRKKSSRKVIFRTFVRTLHIQVGRVRLISRDFCPRFVYPRYHSLVIAHVIRITCVSASKSYSSYLKLSMTCVHMACLNCPYLTSYQDVYEAALPGDRGHNAPIPLFRYPLSAPFNIGQVPHSFVRAAPSPSNKCPVSL